MSQEEPFRRSPTQNERVQMHEMKSLLAKKNSKLLGTRKRHTTLLRNMEQSQKALINLARKVALFREEKRRIDKADDKTDNCKDSKELPMIVGTNLEHVIDPFIAKPQESYEVIKHLSNLAILQEDVNKNLIIHDESNNLHTQIESSRIEYKQQTEEVENLERRCNRLKDSAMKFGVKEMREKLNFAVQQFWCHGCTLEGLVSNSTPSTSFEDSILTKYVKKQRRRGSSTEQRLTKLLCEVHNAYNSTNRVWDSSILLSNDAVADWGRNLKDGCFLGNDNSLYRRNGHAIENGSHVLFRYSRRNFIDLAEQEINRVKRSNIVLDQSSPKLPGVVGIQQSQKYYEQRKQSAYNSFLDDAKSLVGCCVKLFDRPEDMFLVKSCDVTWIENMTRPKVIHLLVNAATKALSNDSSRHSVEVCLLETPHYVTRQIATIGVTANSPTGPNEHCVPSLDILALTTFINTIVSSQQDSNFSYSKCLHILI